MTFWEIFLLLVTAPVWVPFALVGVVMIFAGIMGAVAMVIAVIEAYRQ